MWMWSTELRFVTLMPADFRQSIWASASRSTSRRSNLPSLAGANAGFLTSPEHAARVDDRFVTEDEGFAFAQVEVIPMSSLGSPLAILTASRKAGP